MTNIHFEVDPTLAALAPALDEHVAKIQQARLEFEPVYEFTPVRHGIASDINVGDMLDDEHVVNVRGTERKAHIYVQGRKTPFSLDRGAPTAFRQRKMTEASREKYDRLLERVTVLNKLRERVAEPEAIREEIRRSLEKGWLSRAAEYLVDLQAVEQIRGYWTHAAGAVVHEGADPVEEYARIQEFLTRQVIDDLDRPTTSGGFTVDNAIKQAIQQRRARTLRHFL